MDEQQGGTRSPAPDATGPGPLLPQPPAWADPHRTGTWPTAVAPAPGAMPPVWPPAAPAGHSGEPPAPVPAFDAAAWAALAPPVVVRPPAGPAVRGIPLAPGALLRESLDALTRSGGLLRPASFHVGLLVLLAAGPATVLLGLLLVVAGDLAALGGGIVTPIGGDAPAGELDGPVLALAVALAVAALPAALGAFAASVEARALAVAVVAGRAEERPLRLVEAVAVARRSFWPLLRAQLLVTAVTGLVVAIAAAWIGATPGPAAAFAEPVQLVVGFLAGIPLVHVPVAVVVGEVGAREALRRSWGLARHSPRLAAAVAVPGAVSGAILQFGLGAGIDVASRVVGGAGVGDALPLALVIPLGAVAAFAAGTLVLVVEAFTLAPVVHAFLALTHYTGGLAAGRLDPAPVRHWWDPWVTPGLVAGLGIGLCALVAGIVAAGS